MVIMKFVLYRSYGTLVSGLDTAYQRLTPLATLYRPCGAHNEIPKG